MEDDVRMERVDLGAPRAGSLEAAMRDAAHMERCAIAEARMTSDGRASPRTVAECAEARARLFDLMHEEVRISRIQHETALASRPFVPGRRGPRNEDE